MRISNLFSHYNPSLAAREPVLEPLAAPEAHGALLADIDHADSIEGDRSNAIFDVIGVTSSTDASQRQCGEAAPGPADVMDVLYAQYCIALDDPHAAVAGDWVTESAPRDEPNATSDKLERQSAAQRGHDASRTVEPIETLLSGAQLMEHAFGPLGRGEAPELIPAEPVPEILRLFAPREYQAAASRRPSTLPPALARREHHSVSIDSAMPVPRAVAHHGDAS